MKKDREVDLVTEVLRFTRSQEAVATSARKNALIGNYEHIRREVLNRHLVANWRSLDNLLRRAGAVAYPASNRIFIDNTIWPGEHTKIVLEHEVVHLTIESAAEARTKLDRLGLAKPLEEDSFKPAYVHYLALLFELQKAKQLDLLQKHLELHRVVAKKNGIQDKFQLHFRENLAARLFV